MWVYTDLGSFSLHEVKGFKDVGVGAWRSSGLAWKLQEYGRKGKRMNSTS